jgi:hypothetical protein
MVDDGGGRISLGAGAFIWLRALTLITVNNFKKPESVVSGRPTRAEYFDDTIGPQATREKNSPGRGDEFSHGLPCPPSKITRGISDIGGLDGDLVGAG